MSGPNKASLTHLGNVKAPNLDWVPDLRPGETILYATTSNSRVFLIVCALGLLFFGYGTLQFYSDYYLSDSLAEACGDQPWRDCGKFYTASMWIVPIGLSVVCILLFAALGTLIGWIRQTYVLTNARALVRRYGPISGVDSFELSDAIIHKGWAGVHFKVGWRKTVFFLDSSQSEMVMDILQQRT